MKKMQFFGAGFTLIELLVVLAVIGLLSAASVSFFSTAAAKSRDARRERDIKTIQSFLAIYANNSGFFPICPTEIFVDGFSDCLSSALIDQGAAQVVSKDPRHGVGTGSCGDASSFYYCYQSADGRSYTVRYLLETNSIQGKSAGWQTISP